jgi:hypothetical protein
MGRTGRQPPARIHALRFLRWGLWLLAVPSSPKGFILCYSGDCFLAVVSYWFFCLCNLCTGCPCGAPRGNFWALMESWCRAHVLGFLGAGESCARQEGPQQIFGQSKPGMGFCALCGGFWAPGELLGYWRMGAGWSEPQQVCGHSTTGKDFWALGWGFWAWGMVPGTPDLSGSMGRAHESWAPVHQVGGTPEHSEGPSSGCLRL